MPTLDTIQIPLTLNAAQVNYILKWLGAAPYAEVADLIAAIRKQGDPVMTATATESLPSHEKPRPETIVA